MGSPGASAHHAVAVCRSARPSLSPGEWVTGARLGVPRRASGCRCETAGVSTPLATLGGKAANLVELQRAGFPVPAFVVLETDEYREFVAGHDLDAVIASAVAGPAEEASRIIRAAFDRPMAQPQRQRILNAVAPLLDRPLAVRSSATAEDLPEASFAGQQDNFLDVRGEEAVLAAVVACWSSLWTERAISYRAHAGVPSTGIALAVVIQELVDAEASGVLFTADPLTGHRGHTVIDAVFGLGEKLVSGLVVPDSFTVETRTGRVLQRKMQGEQPTLSDTQVTALTELGRRIAAHFGQPQDIEWTRVGEDLRVVQSRAVTSLYPLPEADGGSEALWLSLGGFQGMLDPLTPLGQDVLRRMLTGAAPALGGRVIDYRTNPYLRVAGERLWVRFDHLVRGPAGRVVAKVLPIGDPGAAGVIATLATEPAFAPHSTGGTLRVLRAALHFVGPMLPRIVRAFHDPNTARSRFEREIGQLVTDLEDRLVAAANAASPQERLDARVRAVRWLTDRAFPVLLPAFGPFMGPSIGLMKALRSLAASTGLPDADALALRVMRSLPGNVTTEMDLALYAVARAIDRDPLSRARFDAADAEELAASYLAATLPDVAQDALTSFLERFGMRGVAEIDVGTPRWSEQPEVVIRTVQSFLNLAPESAPDALYERGRIEALAAIEQLAAALPALKARQLRFVAGRLRGLFGARETPKFTIVRAFSLARAALQSSGADLVEASVVADPDDIFFLHLDELAGAIGGGGLRDVVDERRGTRRRELRRARVPIAMVGDGRTFYSVAPEGSGADLSGLGVSPGVVEGLVRIVDDPGTSELQPGEILVCRGTDPAWTPLFLTASGLVTEVGGLMTHGSVVAREYGLPAVVGVSGATTQLTTGQRVRLDGGAGTITLC